MATRTQLNALLKTPLTGLTGQEAARLILTNTWEKDHHREGFLSAREVNNIMQRLSETQRQAYNRYVALYRIADYLLKGAHVLALEICRSIHQCQVHFEHMFLMDVWRLYQRTTPTIVTEKQYQDILTRKEVSLEAQESEGSTVPEQRFLDGSWDDSWASYAVLQKPQEHQIDSEGYFLGSGFGCLLDELSQLERAMEEQGIAMESFLWRHHQVLCDEIAQFLVSQAILKALALLLEVPLEEELNRWYADVHSDVELYNASKRHPLRRGENRFDLPALRDDRLHPTAASLRCFAEKALDGRHSGWWGDAVGCLRFVQESRVSIEGEEAVGEDNEEVLDD